MYPDFLRKAQITNRDMNLIEFLNKKYYNKS